MPDRDLLIPGTSGCKLLANGEDIGWPAELTAEAWAAGSTGLALSFPALGVHFSQDEIVQMLSMEFAEPGSVVPTKTTLVPGSSIAPGPHLKAVYNQFDFEPFVYDWRGDIRHTGRLLLDHLKNRPAGGKWRIAAHSQGGLAVVVASILYAQENADSDTAFSDLVSHVAFIATPFHGTVNAAKAILIGDNLSGPFAESFKKIVRTWPAIHQMLPAWPGCVRKRAPGGELIQPYNLMYEEPWAGLSVSSDMLQRARDTRTNYLRSPFSRMKNVKLLAFFSEAWPTANRLLLDDGRLVVAPSSDDEHGDTLVPAQATLAMSNDLELQRFVMLRGDNKTMKHFALSIDNVVAPGVKTFFAT